MSRWQDGSNGRRACRAVLGTLLALGGARATAMANSVFTWDPAGASPSVSAPAFTADAIQATHYLYDIAPAAITPTFTYTVNFLEPITGFSLGGSSFTPMGLNGTPGAPGSYGL